MSAPFAAESSPATALAAKKNTVTAVSEIVETAIPAPEKTAASPAARKTQTRRGRPRSTAGEYRKNQTVGSVATATIFAIRSTGTPWLRSRYGARMTMMAFENPYGIERSPNSQGGL